MPNLPHSAFPAVGNLRTYLESILPSAQLTDIAVDSTFQPILLLQTNIVIAAFAFSGSDMRKSYDTLYGGFKNHYAKQQGQWDALDLAFVFCVQPGGISDLEHFCSKVETDVYFCRKFVVLLVPPMSASLSRLPFLPLMTPSGQSIRPASAQTFLKQCNVPALLAKFIVVQSQEQKF